MNLCSKNVNINSMINKYSQKYAQISNLTIKLVDLSTNIEYKVVNNAQNKNNYYVIIYDPTHKHKIYHGECYYCNSLEDAEAILQFILENEEIFVENLASDDVMNQKDLVYIDDQRNYKLISLLTVDETEEE